MNFRFLVPCAGLIGGILTGGLTRPDPPPAAPAAAGRIPALNDTVVSFRAARPTNPAIAKLSDLRALWTDKDGDLILYENLAGVPATTLLGWLNELMPPESYNRSLEQERRDALRHALVERLAEQDPSALTGWLLRVPRGSVDSGWIATAIHALCERNPPDAATLLDRLGKISDYALSLRLEEMAARDPEAALEKFLTNVNAGLPEAAARWLITDPPRALAFCNENPRWCFGVLQAVAEQGNAALAEFAAGLTNPEVKAPLQKLQLIAAAREGDAATLTRFLELEGRNRNDYFQDQALRLFAFCHPEKVETIARQLADRPDLSSTLLRKLAVTSPESVAAILANPETVGLGKVPGDLSFLVSTLSRTWSLKDPGAALEWLRAMPDDRRAKVAPAAFDITQHLPAAEWLALTRGLPIAADGAAALAEQVQRRTSDPAVIAQWCATFPDNSRPALLQQLTPRMQPEEAADLTRRVQEALPPLAP